MVIPNAKIYEAVKQVNPLKAPGPDGMQVIFNHKCWNVIDIYVCNMVRSSFNHGHMLKELVMSYITFVSENNYPVSTNHYKPISLCSIFMKLYLE